MVKNLGPDARAWSCLIGRRIPELDVSVEQTSTYVAQKLKRDGGPNDTCRAWEQHMHATAVCAPCSKTKK